MLPLLLVLFVSGACGLTYQVLWLRLLSLVFGVTAHAASAVLASFMTGLALGSFLSGRLSQRVKRPLLWFGVAELLIGLSALATPLALTATQRLYFAMEPADDGLALRTVMRFVCAMAVLIVPTTLMGATLPLVTASSLVRHGAVAARISALYGSNTTGAIVGAILTGFYMIGGLGIRTTFLCAAALNGVAGAIAIYLSHRHERADTASPVMTNAANAADAKDAKDAKDATNAVRAVDSTPTADSMPATAAGVASLSADGATVMSRAARLMPIVFIISGFASLALEVIWFRLLVLFLPATAYAFATMLATVLGGIAAGGWIAARVLRRERNWLTWLTVIQIATGFAVVGSMLLLAETYGRGWRTSGTIQGSVVAILPAALLMGLAFPIGLRLAAGDALAQSRAIARRLGSLYAVNVLGAIAGSTLAGFLFLPLFGSRASLVFCAALYVASGLLLATASSRPRRAVAFGVISAALFAIVALEVPTPFDATLKRRYGLAERVYWHDEGVQTTVAVHGTTKGHVLYLDGLHQANDTPGMLRVHRQIGHLAVMLHRDPKEALVIGLGGGVTAGAVSQHALSLDVVELSDGVRQAARWFAHVNDDVLKQPNVALHVDDGRSFLARQSERYDVITADIIQPIHAGAGMLYSVEYFRLAKQALKDDGLMLQWVGHRTRSHYELIVRTFQSAFPHTTLWLDGTLLVGSKQPLVLHRESFARQLAEPRTRAALDRIGLDSFDTLVSWYTAGPKTIRRVIGRGRILSDDHPVLEYHRSLPPDPTVIDITPFLVPDAAPHVAGTP